MRNTNLNHSEQSTDKKTEKPLYIAPMAQFVPLIEESLALGKNVNFSPRGVSMLPMLRQGVDSVTLSPVTSHLKKYDIPLYKRDNGRYILHRVVKRKGDTYTCIGDNQYKKEEGVKHESIIAVVSAFTRDDKTHSVNELGYRLYCRFWCGTRFIRRIFSALKRRAGKMLRLAKSKFKNKR